MKREKENDCRKGVLLPIPPRLQFTWHLTHSYACPKTKQNRERTLAQIKQIPNHQNLSDSHTHPSKYLAESPKLQTGNGLARKKERKKEEREKGGKKKGGKRKQKQ